MLFGLVLKSIRNNRKLVWISVYWDFYTVKIEAENSGPRQLFKGNLVY